MPSSSATVERTVADVVEDMKLMAFERLEKRAQRCLFEPHEFDMSLFGQSLERLIRRLFSSSTSSSTDIAGAAHHPEDSDWWR